MWRFKTGDELIHHGIKGQRWGIRRYQRKDGSLTPAGKKRAAKLAKKYQAVTGTEISSGIKTKRRMQDMSNEELAERIARYNLESQYMQAVSNRQKQRASSESFVKKMLKEHILPQAASGLKEAIKNKAGKIIGDLWEEKIGPELKIDKYSVQKNIDKNKRNADLAKEINRLREEVAKRNVYKNMSDADIYKMSNNRLSAQDLQDLLNKLNNNP